MFSSNSQIKDLLRIPTVLFVLKKNTPNILAKKEKITICICKHENLYVAYCILAEERFNKRGTKINETNKINYFWFSEIKTLSLVKCFIEKNKLILNGKWVEEKDGLKT